MSLLESSEPGKNVETEFWRKVQNSTFESTEIHLNVRSDQPIWLTVWYSRKWSKTRFFQGNNTKHVLRPGFFCRLRLKTRNYVFSSDSAAIWALAYGPSPENDWISRFEPILKKADFRRFWTSCTAPNNGDIQFLTSNSDSAQSITPIREFWAQCLVTYMVFQVPQKCDFRPSR